MKNISAAMQAHIKQDVVTLTTCWKIKRMDGKVFAFTELDRDLTYLGITYKSTGGFNKSAIKGSASMSVDNLEVSGFLSDETLAEDELRNGSFDYAEVEIFMVNYMDLSMGDIKLRYGFFGEVKTAPSGAFLVELRGLLQLLSQKIGEVYTPECRADLGDSRCKIKLFPDERYNGKLYKLGDKVLAYQTPDAAYKPNVTVSLNNPDFEDGVTGWSYSGFGNFTVTELNMVLPYTGMRYAAATGTNTISQMGNLLVGPVDAAALSSGNMRLRFSGYFASVREGQQPRIKLTYYTGANRTGSIIKTSTTMLASPLYRTWEYRELVEPIPPNARSVYLTMDVGGYPVFGSASLGIDKVGLDILWPSDVTTDYSRFAGVEYLCTSAGRAAATAPVFNPVLGAITKDGGVEWTAVAPTHSFLDQVAVDSANSSTLVLTTSDKPDGWFDWGVLKILTGENAGMAVEPISWNNTTKTLQLAMPLPHQTLAGTYVQITTGCDKRRSTCKAKFTNLLNFRGEPDIPGVGQYFKVAGLD